MWGHRRLFLPYVQDQLRGRQENFQRGESLDAGPVNYIQGLAAFLNR